MLPELRALRVCAAIRRGSSWPVLVHTARGDFVTKLRGAAQGLAPLVAEIIVGELATALGLPVPERALIALDAEVPSDDKRDELADLLGRSHGLNLGFRELSGARDLRDSELSSIDPDLAASVLWLDGLVMNPDRTPNNPNIMLWHRQPWLIDHGATLGFHYDWAGLTEQLPREPRFDWRAHLFASHLERTSRLDRQLAARLGRDALARATEAVPDDFLRGAFPNDDPLRTRAAYAAVLWKRLAPPRPFLAVG